MNNNNKNKEKIELKNIIIYCNNKKFIIGLKRDFYIVLLMLLLFFSMYIGSMIFYSSFYNMKIIIFITILFTFTIYNYLSVFFREPGIIPRNYSSTEMNSENIKISISTTEEEITKKNVSKIMRKYNDITPQCEKDAIKNINKIEETESNENNNNNNNLNESIPYIFQKKPCVTCNIIRPETCSHCSVCDNCIIGMDHHCYYISNCVGIRNHKNFYLFLIFGTILCFFGIIFIVYHIIYILFLFNFNITKSFYKNYYILIFISLTFMFIIPIVINFSCRKQYLKIIISSVFGHLLFIYIFYLNSFKFKLNFFYFHPFGLNVLEGLIPCFIFVLKTFVVQTRMIGKGLTVKQFKSIVKQRNELIDNENDDYILMEKYLTQKFKLINIFRFLNKKIPKSLVNK